MKSFTKPFWKYWIESFFYTISIFVAAFAAFFFMAFIATYLGMEILVGILFFLLVVTIIAFCRWLGGD